MDVKDVNNNKQYQDGEEQKCFARDRYASCSSCRDRCDRCVVDVVRSVAAHVALACCGAARFRALNDKALQEHALLHFLFLARLDTAKEVQFEIKDCSEQKAMRQATAELQMAHQACNGTPGLR